MEIERPKQPGSYLDREFDCARALQATFERQAGEQAEQYLDSSRLALFLLEPALSAGWTPEDVQAAVKHLANNQQRSDGKIHKVENGR